MQAFLSWLRSFIPAQQVRREVEVNLGSVARLESGTAGVPRATGIEMTCQRPALARVFRKRYGEPLRDREHQVKWEIPEETSTNPLINMKLTCLIFLATLASLASLSTASAQIIGIDFYVGSTTNQSPGSSAVVGPYASAGWYNDVDPSTAPGPVGLRDSTDALTTGTFGFTQGGNTLTGNPIYNSSYGAEGSANATLTPDQQLYNGSVAAIAQNWSQELVLGNIPYAKYSVYLLVNAPQVASNTPSIIGSIENFNGGVVGGAGSTYFFQNSNDISAYIPPTLGYVQATGTSLGSATTGANYVLFSDLTNPNETFDLLDLTPSGQPYLNNISLGAVEIVDDAPPPATPEPSANALMLAGLGFLVVMSRRRKIFSA